MAPCWSCSRNLTTDKWIEVEVTSHPFINHVNVFSPFTALMVKSEEINFSNTKMETLINEVESKPKLLFG